MYSFAESDHAKIGNVPKIIFNIHTAQDVPGAAHAARNGSRHVQCIECSQENIPGKLLSVYMGHMGRIEHMEKPLNIQERLKTSGLSMLGGGCPRNIATAFCAASIAILARVSFEAEPR